MHSIKCTRSSMERLKKMFFLKWGVNPVRFSTRPLREICRDLKEIVVSDVEMCAQAGAEHDNAKQHIHGEQEAVPAEKEQLQQPQQKQQQSKPSSAVQQTPTQAASDVEQVSMSYTGAALQVAQPAALAESSPGQPVGTQQPLATTQKPVALPAQQPSQEHREKLQETPAEPL